MNILPEQSRLIWKISFLTFLSSIYALYNKHYDLFFVPGGIFITSINYWKNPSNLYNKYIDIYYVNITLIYQLLRAYNSEYEKIYYTIQIFGLLFYPLSLYYWHIKYYWLSTYLHILYIYFLI
jgi:hypothetical protein